MTLFIQAGAQVRLPSGTQASFIRWAGRVVGEDAPRGVRVYERVAVLRVGNDLVEFSESFVRKNVRVMEGL